MIMKISKKNIFLGILFILLPIILYMPFYFMRDTLASLADSFAPCYFLDHFGVQCPGCGNTRCVKEILNLHFISAWKYNITIPLFICLFLFYYYVWALKKFGIVLKRRVKREVVISVFLVILLIYYIVRNFI